MDDWQLIHEYATRHSETAFRLLVDRYVNLVHSAALRQVRDRHLAQEIAQAVFILLARKAGKLPKHIVLAGWLHRTTRFVASRALRTEQRRQQRETQAYRLQHEHPACDDTWRRVAPVLDEAIQQLNEEDRNAVLLRFFHEQPLHKVGDALGISEEAARKRIVRALEKLRLVIARRGFTLSAGVLVGSLTAHTEAVSAELCSAIAQGAWAQASPSAITLPSLVAETIKAWRWTKLRIGAGLGAAGIVVLLLLMSGIKLGFKPDPGALDIGAEAQPAAPVPGLGAGEDLADAPPPAIHSARHFAFRAVDADTGEGLAGARVLATFISPDRLERQTITNLIADESGRCDVPIPFSRLESLSVGALVDGYELRNVTAEGRNTIPDGYVLKLPRGSWIGGVVRDESGNPVAGAEIRVRSLGGGDTFSSEFLSESRGFDVPLAKTDEFGCWSFSSAPANDLVVITVEHSDFPAVVAGNDGISDGRVMLKSADLRAGIAEVVLEHGPTLEGVVVDEQHNPIINAKVEFSESQEGEGCVVLIGKVFSRNLTVQTAANGSFAFKNLVRCHGAITVTAHGLAPEHLPVDVGAATPVTVQLKPADLLRLRLVDDLGNGLKQAGVQLQTAFGCDWIGYTDDHGRIECHSAPRGKISVVASAEGFFNVRTNLAVADTEEHIITLHPQLVVSGFVTDSETKLPIVTFKAVPDSGSSDRDRANLVYGTNGHYELAFDERKTPLLVRFEAEGYEPAASKLLDPDARTLSCDVELTRRDPRDVVRGIVLLPGGTPATGAQVAVSGRDFQAFLGPAKLQYDRRSMVLDTDTKGRFTFPYKTGARSVVAVHEHGIGCMRLYRTNLTLAVQLEPWGRIEGHLALRNQTSANRRVIMTSPMHGLEGLKWQPFMLNLYAFSTKTDEQGNFAFEQVPPGEYYLWLVPGLNTPHRCQTPVRVPAGEIVHVQVGGTGMMLSGRLVTSGLDQSIDWTKQVHRAVLSAKVPERPLPAPPAGLKPEEAREWLWDYLESEGQSIPRAWVAYPVDIKADGIFTIDDVLAGAYQLIIEITETVSDPTRIGTTKRHTIGSAQQDILVPQAIGNASADTLEIGTVTVITQRSGTSGQSRGEGQEGVRPE